MKVKLPIGKEDIRLFEDLVYYGKGFTHSDV